MKNRFSKLAVLTAMVGGLFVQQAESAENALDFDGVNDTLLVSTGSSLGTSVSNFSIAAWVKPSAYTSEGLIVVHGQNNVAVINWGIQLNGNKLAAVLRVNETTVTYPGTKEINLHEWTHVAMTLSGTTLTLYVNGVEDSVTTTPGSPTPSTTVTQIGGNARPGGSAFFSMFKGTIDELSIWNKVLTEAEVGLIMNETFTKSADAEPKVTGSVTHTQISTLLWGDLLAYYPMNEGLANTTTTDISDAGLVGNFGVNGAPSWVASSTKLATLPKDTITVDDYIQTFTNTPVTFNVKSNNSNGTDIDPYNKEATVVSTSFTGQLTPNNSVPGEFTYEPATDDLGIVSFEYELETGGPRATVTIHVSDYLTTKWPVNRMKVSVVNTDNGSLTASNIDYSAYSDGDAYPWLEDQTARIVEVNPNREFTLNVTVWDDGGNNGYVWGGMTLWIDWNNDGIFDTTTGTLEQYNGDPASGTVDTANLQTHTLLITPPSNAVLGSTCMRIITSESAMHPHGDGSASGRGIDFTVNVVASADPIATSDSYIAKTSTLFSGNVKDNDLNSTGHDALVVTGQEPSNGTLNLNVDGTFTYTSYARFVGIDSFTYELGSDGNQTTVSIDVKGMLLHYKFDDLSGTTVKDEINTTNNGTVLSGTNLGWTNDGKYGGAYITSANGLDKYYDKEISLPVTEFNKLTTQSTLAFWFKGDSGNLTSTIIHGSSGAHYTNDREMYIHLPDNGKVFMDWTKNQRSYATLPGDATSNAARDGTWHHWTFTKNATTGTQQIYLDGEALTPMSHRTANNHTHSAFTYFYIRAGLGVIDDLKLFNYALDETEVATLHHAVTSAISVNFVQQGKEFTWDVNTEVGVIEYQIVVNGAVVATITPDGSSPYTYTLESDDKAELVIVEIEIPIAISNQYTTKTATTLSDNVKDNDFNCTSHDALVVIGKEPSNGTLNLNIDGTFTYIANAKFAGIDSFTYELGSGGDQAIVNINVIGMLLHYKFDETSGSTVKDEISTANNGTVLSGTNLGWISDGKFGGAYSASANGLNKYYAEEISLPVTEFNKLTTQSTLAFWFKGDSGNLTSTIIHGSSGTHYTNDREMYIHLPDNGKVFMDWTKNQRSYATLPGDATSNAARDGIWHHWAFTKNATTGTQQIYLDGEALTPMSHLTANTHTHSKFTYFYIRAGLGAIDEFKLFNYALDATEVAELHNISTPAIGLELVQEGRELTWTLDEEVGVIRYEIMVNGQVIATIKADGSNSYTYTLPSDEKAELVVIDNHGSQTYPPIDGNLVTTPYQLVKGWNLIAITGDNANIAPLVAAANGPLWAWNGSHYVHSITPTATEAIWIDAKASGRVDVTGEKSDATIALTTGWNLVGPINNAKVPTEAMSVFSYDKTYNDITEQDNVLMRGVGYWIFSL